MIENPLPPYENSDRPDLEDGALTYQFIVEDIDELYGAMAYALKALHEGYKSRGETNQDFKAGVKKPFYRLTDAFVKIDPKNRRRTREQFEELIKQNINVLPKADQETLSSALESLIGLFFLAEWSAPMIILTTMHNPYGEYALRLETQGFMTGWKDETNIAVLREEPETNE